MTTLARTTVRCPRGKVRAPSGRCIKVNGAAHRKHIQGGAMPPHKSSSAKSPRQMARKIVQKQKDADCPQGKIRSPSGRCIDIDGATHRKYIRDNKMPPLSDGHLRAPPLLSDSNIKSTVGQSKTKTKNELLSNSENETDDEEDEDDDEDEYTEDELFDVSEDEEKAKTTTDLDIATEVQLEEAIDDMLRQVFKLPKKTVAKILDGMKKKHIDYLYGISERYFEEFGAYFGLFEESDSE